MPRGLSAFVDIRCHEGFHCVSAVDVFGINHDGPYMGLPRGDEYMGLPKGYRGAYEDGCPARGEMTQSNDCRDFGKGPVNHCWSDTRYESGADSPCKDPTMCMCVKGGSNGTSVQVQGDKETPNKSGESIMGVDLYHKKYLVQPEPTCQECASLNCDRTACNACKNCEYGTKTLAGRTSTGCYSIDSGAAMRDRKTKFKGGRMYLYDGMEGISSKQTEQDLVVIPHYRLWRPGSLRMGAEVGGTPEASSSEVKGGHFIHILRFPYEDRGETLGKEKWTESYKEAAPEIQRTIDLSVDSMKEWGPKANDIDCTQDVTGRITKFNIFRRECRRMQSLEAHLAPSTPFESKVPDDNGSYIPVRCIMGGQGMCQRLNCYADDAELIKSADQMKERAETCHKASGILSAEEAVNGPVSEEAKVSAKTGGRLEVALPAPGVAFKEKAPGGPAADNAPVPPNASAMPVGVGLALLSAVGAVSSTQRNFFPSAVASSQRLGPSPSRGCDGPSCPKVAHQQTRRKHAAGALSDFLFSDNVAIQ